MSKKHGLGTVLLIGAAAAVVAGGVISYIKRAEIKKLAEDIITRVKTTDAKGVYTVEFGVAGQGDAESDDVSGAGRTDAAAADTGEPNIVDSGISLESVEMTEPDAVDTETADTGAEPKPENEPETGETAAEAEDEDSAAEHISGGMQSDGAPEDEETDGEEEPPEDMDGEGQYELIKKRLRFWSR